MAVTARAVALAALAALAACNTRPATTADPPKPPAPAPVASSLALDSGAPPEAPGAGGLNHVLCTGQSLSTGTGGRPVLSTAQPFDALMFAAGVRPAADAGLDDLAPLVESGQETMSTSFAALVHELGGERHRLLVSCHGVGGIAYAGLKKGTPPYARGLDQVAAGARLARARGLPYVVRAVTNVHGETDHVLQNADYAKNLADWQADYERDVRAITGQTEPIPMLHSQVSSWTKFGHATSGIPSAQLAASIASGGKLVMVGPKYHLAYARDGIHLSNDGYRAMGEMYAKVYRRVVLEGKRWEPLRPLSATLAGDTIRVVFHVPAPPLVLDTDLVAKVDAYGFEYTDDSASPPTIAAVALDGPDAVKIRLSAPPTAAGRRVRYAFTGAPNAKGGPREGPRGNLRDSDDTRSRLGVPLHDWAVHFDETVR